MVGLSSSIRLAVGGLLIFSAAFAFLLMALLLLPWRVGRIKLGNLYGKLVAPATVTLVGGNRVAIHHRHRLYDAYPAIYVSNHASALDPLLGMWICPTGGVGVAKRELLRIPVFGWLYRLCGHPVIDRSNRVQAIATLDRAAELILEHRLALWIWPEGTRSPDGRLQKFKKGFAHLAIATRLPIVPVIVHGTHHAWPNRSFVLRPRQIDVEVLEAIDTSAWTLQSLDRHIEEVWRVVARALRPDQQPLERYSS